ncbi:MAG: glutamate--tRNA ligase [Spirochaetales bacterium]|jgi:glutamyl-tRNA synthetase|nr:glutamate--tRNA ligase [Spirochaetales bacterium]
MRVRVRYAPSPTGLQHIGHVRTALFDYLLSRANGGDFILRIEDTDQARSTDGAIQDLYDTFEWLGFKWDEGPDVGGPHAPYIQSEKKEIYSGYAEELLEKRYAYRCFCSEERIDALREEKGNKGGGYDRHCRDLSSEQIATYESQDINPVIRFKVPLEGKTTLQDAILGEVSRKNKDIPVDPILVKSDGMPTYHLAATIDDHLMEISHVLRAQEWLPSAGLHILLYKAFGWEPPVFCHLPVVLGKDGQKLSKRHGSTSMKEFIAAGYLPEAIINYVALLGWSFDDQREFFTLDELEKVFTLEKLNKAPAVFDYKKLDWFNGQYIRQKADTELEELLIPYLKRASIVPEVLSQVEKEIIDGMIPLVKERLRLLPQITELVRFLFQDVPVSEPGALIPKRLDAVQTKMALVKGREILADFMERDDEGNEELFRKASEELGIKLGDILMPLRVSVTGSPSSPPLFGSMRLLGSEKTLFRVDRAIGLLENAES